MNDCIRRIFTFNRWESVRYLRLSFGHPSLTEIFESRSAKFFRMLPALRNPTLKHLYELALLRSWFDLSFFFLSFLCIFFSLSFLTLVSSMLLCALSLMTNKRYYSWKTTKWEKCMDFQNHPKGERLGLWRQGFWRGILSPMLNDMQTHAPEAPTIFSSALRLHLDQ